MSDAIVLDVADTTPVRLDVGDADPIAREEIAELAGRVTTVEGDVSGIDARVDAIEADGSVTTAKLADGAVSTVKLANDAVTGAKLDKDDGVFSAIFTEMMPTWNNNSGHIKSTDGNVSVNNVFDYTDYIECGDCEYVGIWVNFYATGVGLAFYDKRQRFVSGVEFTFAGSDYAGMDLFRAIPVPEDAVYFRTTRAPYRTIRDEVYGAFKPLRQSIQALQSEAAVPNLLYPQLEANWHVSSGHIRPDNGNVSSNTTFGYCDYVACSGYAGVGVWVNFNAAGAGVAFYDSEYNYIFGVPFNFPSAESAAELHVIPVPEGAAYFRSTIMTTRKDYNKEVYGCLNASTFDGMSLGKHYTCLKDGTGDFDNIVSAIKTACATMGNTLYIGAGTWDIIADFGGQSAVESMISNSNRGLVLKNRVHVVCSSESLIKCEYEGSNATTIEHLSAFNSGKYGFTLENARIQTAKCRYCIHDERDTSTDHYKNVYKNCQLTHNNDTLSGGGRFVIGGGLGKDGHIVIDGCIFDNPAFSQASGQIPIVAYHNTWYRGGTGRSMIEITNSYFVGNTTTCVSYFGDSTEMTKAIIANNSVGSAPYLRRESTSTSLGVATDIVNIKLLAWNNDIHS